MESVGLTLLEQWCWPCLNSGVIQREAQVPPATHSRLAEREHLIEVCCWEVPRPLLPFYTENLHPVFLPPPPRPRLPMDLLFVLRLVQVARFKHYLLLFLWFSFLSAFNLLIFFFLFKVLHLLCLLHLLFDDERLKMVSGVLHSLDPYSVYSLLQRLLFCIYFPFPIDDMVYNIQK